MIKKFLAVLLLAGFSLNAEMPIPGMDALNASHSSHHHHHRHLGLRNYAVLSNQLAVTSGNNILWSPSNNTSTSGITVNGDGAIPLPSAGVYLVQYTVRITKTPYDGTSTAIVQLQQTASGTPANITQSAITSNSSIDGVSYGVPGSQYQITGYALVTVTSAENNVLNLLLTITGGDLSLPATTGYDANAQLSILQVH